MRESSILIKNGIIITMDENNRIFRGDLLIRDDKIAAIDNDIDNVFPDIVIDAANMLIIPGFVQTHTHLCQTLFRGLADDEDVVDWLKNRIWPLESAHNEDSIYASALLSIAELISSGTTCVLSMETTRHTDAVFQAVKDSGFRAITGNAMMDVTEPGTEMKGLSHKESISECKRLHSSWHNSGCGRIKYAVMPRGARNCSPELVKEARKFARDNGLIVHTHVSENGPLSKRLLRETGLSDMQLLDQQNVADENLVIAHAIWLTEKDIQIISDRNVKIAHCPSANMKLASGFCKVPELLNKSISISLGADGAPCNNNLDIFNEMRLAALIHKPRCGPKSMDAGTVLRMATTGGAECLGLDKDIGSLEVGKQADVVLLRKDSVHCSPQPGVPEQSRIVYSMNASNVDTTIIAGKVLYQAGRLLIKDSEEIVARANRQLKYLLERVPFGHKLLSRSVF